MRFLAPADLAWASLGLAVAALYLFRPRPRTVAVSTLLFFKALAREHQESAWLRRLKRLLSFLLSLAVVLGATCALARPVVAPSGAALRGVVILVDRSASMAAPLPDGRTRLEGALAEVRARLAGLPGGTGVLVMAYDRRPEILLPRTVEPREIERALESVRVRPVAGDPGPALALAGRLAALDAPAAIWHATDGDAGEAEGTPVERLGGAAPGPVNAGLTGFQLRRMPLERGRLEAFVQVHATAAAPLDVALEIRIDGTLSGVRRMTIPPGGRERLLLPLDAGEGQVLSLRTRAEGDLLALDDELHARIPEARPVRVLWIAPEPDPFTELALASLAGSGDVEVMQGGPADWPPHDPVDVAVLDGWLPEAWPEGTALVVIDPPRALGPIRAVRLAGDGVPLDGVRAVEERHPLLFGVATARVALRQTAVLAADGPLDPIWVGPAGPVLAAGEVRGQRVAVFGFVASRSERLPLLASFPLLVGNAVYWAAQPRAEALGSRHVETGELIAVEGSGVIWTRAAANETVPLRGRWLEADRIGLWRTDAGTEGSASLLSARETLLAGAPAEAGAAGAGAGLLQGEWTVFFLWVVFAVLALEAWLCHRHGVH